MSEKKFMLLTGVTVLCGFLVAIAGAVFVLSVFNSLQTACEKNPTAEACQVDTDEDYTSSYWGGYVFG